MNGDGEVDLTYASAGSSKIDSQATMLGCIHALVDATSVGLVYTAVAAGQMPYEALCLLIILYNALAFGLQFLVGWLADMNGCYRLVGCVGLALLSGAALTYSLIPVAAIVLGSVGNALFHVGAGAWVLRASPGRARESGLFVAPGAMGLVLGVWLGGQPWIWQPVAGVLLIGSLLVLRNVTSAVGPIQQGPPLRAAESKWPIVLIGCLLISVGVRALVGGLMADPWRISQSHVFILAGVAVSGKILGGFLGDYFGWRKLAVVALALTTVVLIVPSRSFGLALLGLLVFQFTMPITLAALYLLFPTRPGLAFGLPSLALLLGALPGLVGISGFLHATVIPIIVLFSAGILWVGLSFKGALLRCKKTSQEHKCMNCFNKSDYTASTNRGPCHE